MIGRGACFVCLHRSGIIADDVRLAIMEKNGYIEADLMGLLITDVDRLAMP